MKVIMEKSEKNKKQLYVGQVMSDKMDKTIVVKTVRTVKHPLFHKIVRKKKMYKVHDEQNSAQVDDLVKIIESKPMSKEKRWSLVEVLNR